MSDHRRPAASRHTAAHSNAKNENVRSDRSSKAGTVSLPGQALQPAERSMVASASAEQHPVGQGSARGNASVDRKARIPVQQGQLVPRGFRQRPVVAAENYDVVSFAKAMNDDFAPRVQALFRPEVDAALAAHSTGIYVSWRLPGQKFDCQRVGMASLCFCGHMLSDHENYNGHSVRVPCAKSLCHCRAFEWIPSRPEDVGEFWFQRRRDFDPTSWRARCRCKHSHDEHDVSSSSKGCHAAGCRCGTFDSNFLCAACDKHWEEHQTFFETEHDRQSLGLPIGEAYLPFAEMPNLRNAALTGDEADESAYRSLLQGPRARPAITPGPVGNHAVVRHQGRTMGSFRPVYD